METITSKIRKWGNSYGIIITGETLKKQGLRDGEEVEAILLKKSNVLRETFGTHKFSKPIKKLMKEVDKELYDI